MPLHRQTVYAAIRKTATRHYFTRARPRNNACQKRNSRHLCPGPFRSSVHCCQPTFVDAKRARARLSFLTSPTADAFSARPFLSTISAATKKNPANNGRFPANHCAGERSRVSFRDYNNNYFARVQYARVPTCARRAHNTVPERRRRIGMEKKKLKKIRFPSRRFLDRTVRNILKCASILRCLN